MWTYFIIAVNYTNLMCPMACPSQNFQPDSPTHPLPHLVFRLATVWACALRSVRTTSVAIRYRTVAKTFGTEIAASAITCDLQRWHVTFIGELWPSVVTCDLQWWPVTFTRDLWPSVVTCDLLSGNLWPSAVTCDPQWWPVTFSDDMWPSAGTCDPQWWPLTFSGDLWPKKF